MTVGSEELMLAYLFVIIAVALRFFPHPFQFTPVAASLLFFGAHVQPRKMWVPLLLLAGWDIALTRFVYGYPLTTDHFITWASYELELGLGMLLCHRTTVLRVLSASLKA